METLMCPKCAAPLRNIERNGMTIERCMERGGIFLDRGELERLIQAEGEFNARALQDDRFRDERGVRDERFRDERWEDTHDDSRYDRSDRRHKRGGFLGDLLDFG